MSSRAVGLLLTLALLSLLLVSPLRSYLAAHGDLERLERQAAVLEQTNHRLQDQIRKLQDPAELERLARECLGMVHPGEIAFVVVPKKGAPTPPDCG